MKWRFASEPVRTLLRFALLLSILGGSVSASPGARTLQVTGEARIGGGYDSNVFETVREDRRVTDGYAALEAGILLRGAGGGFYTGPRARIRWAAERFLSERPETRQHLWGELSWRWGSRESWLSCTASGAQRVFPTDEVRDVTRLELSGAGRLRVSPRGRVFLRLQGVDVRTAEGGPSERDGWLATGEYWHFVQARWQLYGRLEGGRTRFERMLPSECSGGQPSGPLDQQRDGTVLAGVGLVRGGAPFLRGFYGVRVTDSSVAGFSLQRHEFELQAGWMLPARISMQILAQWHLSDYRDECRALEPSEDPEDPELGARNAITLQLRRPLARGLSAELLTSWHRNEALILGRYYEKVVIQAALRYAVGSAE